MPVALLLLAPAVAPQAPEAAVGTPVWIYALIALVVAAAAVVGLVFATRRGGRREQPCPSCGKIMMPDWDRCMFCKRPRDVAADEPAPRGPSAIEFVSGPLSGQTVALDGEVTTIGSAPGVSVMLQDAGVSRKHAGIRRNPDLSFELADLGSTNGVYVNGEKVARRKLQLGDVIRIGTSEMVLK